MNDERRKKLEALRSDKVGKEFVILSNGEAFLDVITSKITELKKTLGLPIEIKGIDGLIDELENVTGLDASIKELKEALTNFKFPEAPQSMEVNGLEKIVEAVKQIEPKSKVTVDWVNKESLATLTNSLDGVKKAVEESSVKPTQQASDYRPFRRVIKVGSRYFFDDNPTNTGGGGGGGSSGGISTNDGTFATPENQTAANTALSAIKTGVETLDDTVVSADSVASATQKGIPNMIVRDDVLTTVTPADGDQMQARGDAYGATWMDMATRLDAANDSITAIINSGSLTSVVPGTTATALGKAEDAAHASGDTGVATWGVRYETLTAPAAANDYTFQQTDDLGKLVTQPYAPPVNHLQGITAAMTATTRTAVIAAQAAGVRIYVTGIHVINTHATVATEVVIEDGTTTIDRFYVPALSEQSREYPTPLKGTAATALNATNVTTGSNTYVQAVGFKAL